MGLGEWGLWRRGGGFLSASNWCYFACNNCFFKSVIISDYCVKFCNFLLLYLFICFYT